MGYKKGEKEWVWEGKEGKKEEGERVSLAQMVFFFLPLGCTAKKEEESGANVVPPLWQCLTTEVRRKRGYFNTVAPLHRDIPMSPPHWDRRLLNGREKALVAFASRVRQRRNYKSLFLYTWQRRKGKVQFPKDQDLPKMLMNESTH